MMPTPRFEFPPENEEGLPDGFWQRVRDASHHLLMAVYDGTLVPFHPDPAGAVLPARMRDLLQHIGTSLTTRLVVFSGRRISELDTLLDGVPAHLVAEHGWDERTADGRLILHPLPGEAASILGRAARAARESGFGEYLERKRCSITLHTRGLEPEHAARVEAACLHLWGDAFQRRGLRLTRIDGGIELRALATHEGTAVARLLATAPRETLPIYLGDDRADEEAFFQLMGQGVSIRVGPGERDSLARYHLRGPDDVAGFLERWAEVTSL